MGQVPSRPTIDASETGAGHSKGNVEGSTCTSKVGKYKFRAIMSMCGGRYTRLVVEWTVQVPDFPFPCRWGDMISKNELTVFREGMRQRASELGRANWSCRQHCVAHPLVRSAPTH